MPAKMLTADGSFDTRAVTLSNGKPNRSPNAGSAYKGISWAEIVPLVWQPGCLPKAASRLVVLSSYRESDGRNYQSQREKGLYHGLAVDVDGGNLSCEQVVSAVRAVCGKVRAVVYSSASAKPDDRRWRVLIPLAKPLEGEKYEATQQALFDLLSLVGVECDAALARSAQPIYLPNVPPERRDSNGNPLFYVGCVLGGDALTLHDSHPIERVRRANTQDIGDEEYGATCAVLLSIKEGWR